ncbi:MAG: AAA family ATPase, partial [Bacteroidetes bacterium]|nr:AAA family ATPase [Bacteroidota bacterium]
ALPDLKGIAIYDRLDKDLSNDPYLVQMMWSKREIENYFCQEGVLLSYARHNIPFDLFHQNEAEKREKAMIESINEISQALKTLKKIDPWSSNIKATDDFLNPLFEKYFEKLKSENLLRKSGYYLLADLVPKEKIDSEIVEKLDAILKIAKKAKPKTL